MYRSRLIPCLLLSHKNLYKTINFSKPRYIGDPINTVRLFNGKEVDELIILDFTASKEGRQPDFEYLKLITSECFMPLCYGGGVTSLNQMEALFKLGIEKISLNTVLYTNPKLVIDAVRNFGSQSIVASIDIKKDLFGNKHAYIISGEKNTKKSPKEYFETIAEYGVGEVLLTSIDHEGKMNGYDLGLINEISSLLSIPLIAHGGAGTLADCKQAIDAGASATAAGSIFIYYGKRKAVLVNYPKS